MIGKRDEKEQEGLEDAAVGNTFPRTDGSKELIIFAGGGRIHTLRWFGRSRDFEVREYDSSKGKLDLTHIYRIDTSNMLYEYIHEFIRGYETRDFVR